LEQLDWIVLVGTLLFIVAYGSWKTRGSQNVNEYILGGNKAKWWTVGISVMATQASAITFLSTPGQAFHDGMGFVQFYFGLPIAMVIICLVFIPIYHRLKVYTAYEFLEERFNLKTRTLTAVLFLVQRGLAAGITIFAPAIILSSILGWDLRILNVIIGSLVIIYTVTGGTRAVNVTQKHQMFIIMLGMFAAFYLILQYLPEEITFTNALHIAGVNGKMEILDFSLNPESRYTFWSGITGGLFLALAYFGTDQSQVQRYLSGKSVKESQWGLIFNGLLKVPMQFFILLVGVMVFVFFQFHDTPVNFNPKATNIVLASPYAGEYQSLQDKQLALQKQKNTLQAAYLHGLENGAADPQVAEKIKVLYRQDKANRAEARELISKADARQETNDKDYVFIHFILHYLPRGLIGLLLAVILCAAMSSTASELNALGATTAMDLYRRNLPGERSAAHYVKASKWFTVGWGIIAIMFASIGTLFENLIQFVNIVGSIFYGNVLGIFLLAFFFRWVKGNAVFIAALLTQVIVIGIFYFFIYKVEVLGYLWLNFIGCMLVMLLAMLLHTIVRPQRAN
jgi:Na+/proline symporter